MLICHEPWKGSFRTWTIFVLHAQNHCLPPAGKDCSGRILVKTVFKVAAEALESVPVGGEGSRGVCVCVV